MWTVVAKLLGKIAGGAIKGTVDTAKGITDIQKNRLDIKLKERELEEKESVIKPATFDDVLRFDEKVKRIEINLQPVARAKRGRLEVRERRVSLFPCLLTSIMCIILLWGIWRLIVFFATK
jgi:hypothetical protein